MTATLDRLFDVPCGVGVTVLLDAADQAAAKLQEAEWTATFAPPITSYRSCVCGSVMEKRGTDQIDVTPDEKRAAVEAAADMFEAVADMSGRPLLRTLDARVVARVIDAINHSRASAAGDADRGWFDAHANCGDDL